MEAPARSRNVTAVLGPTNTGKTHLAIERMLSHESGMIGLPLRLLAREVYDKIASRVGVDKVALITGEEKIKPEDARYWVSTVEAMPREVDVDFLAIDEIQLAADLERGHTFTDRLLHSRGQLETLLLGAGTMREAIAELIPGANFISRPRLSKLTYSGQKKITRLPARSAIVAFSSNEVYSIAELVRRQRGGAAVVLGALSPRTRNAQVELYQSGDVDYIVATDAVGMGLNLDVDHVAFAAVRKFDGQNYRNLLPAELGQIGGRAGRHLNDGTFGVTGDVEPFENDLVERLENHHFDTAKTLQWRARDLDFSTLENLRESLRRGSDIPRLIRARMADDVIALETLSVDTSIAQAASSRKMVELLWDTCQIPDYRKISTQNHAELVGRIFRDVSGDGVIDEDWFSRQVAFSDRTDGDIDTLANRIAHIRTWTFISNREDWLKDPAHWQGRTREIEDNLSDALHECLTQRFVDKRTSALMKGMRAKDELSADIADDGGIKVEDHFVGRLTGFRFVPDTRAEDLHGKAARSAAAQVLSKELAMRVRRVAAAKNDAFSLTPTAHIAWRGEEIAKLRPGDHPLKPRVEIVCDEHLQANEREKVQLRLDTFVTDIIAERLKPLVDLSKDEEITGLARGIAFQLIENFGMLRRENVANDIKSLDQNARSQLRRYGVRFGAFNIFFPALLKPGPSEVLRTLWLLKSAEAAGVDISAPPDPPRPGLTSLRSDPSVPDAFYAVSGFHLCGPRAVRADMLERLADQIRTLVNWRPDPAKHGATVPRGATGDGGFTVTPEMMSILGCSTDELGEVLRALGFRSEQRPRPEPSVQDNTHGALSAGADAVDTPLKSGEAINTASAQMGDAASADVTTEGSEKAEATPDLDEHSRSIDSVEAASGEGLSAPASAEAMGSTAATEAQAPGDTSAVQPTDTSEGAELQNSVPDKTSGVSATADDAAVPAGYSSEQEQEVAQLDAAVSLEEEPQGERASDADPSSAEPAMIEVWRPRRRSDRGPQHRRQGRGADRAPRHGGGGDEARGRPRRQDRGAAGTPSHVHPGRQSDAVLQPHAITSAPSAAAPNARASEQTEGGERREQGRGGFRNEGGKQRAGARGENGRGGGNGRNRDRDRKQNRRGESGHPRTVSAGPRSKGVDRDSPFAALSALKQALEQQAPEDKSS